MNENIIPLAKPELEVLTATGRTLVLRPVPLPRMPSQDPMDWLEFLNAHVTGGELSPSMAAQVQLFMRTHMTEALTDGESNFTIAGNCLAYCSPDAVKRQLAVDGTDQHGNFDGTAEEAPFVVFDIDKQENIAGPFPTRAEAESARNSILEGGAAHIDAEALLAYQSLRAARLREQVNTAEKTVTFVVEAYAASEHGDGPSFASFEVTQALLDRVEHLVRLCQENGLSEARYAAYPTWGPGDIEEELRLQDGEIVVRPNGSFFYTDYPDVGDYKIESRDHQASTVRAAFTDASHLETVFLTENQELRTLYSQEREADQEEDNTESPDSEEAHEFPRC